jgi:hypothetical protein
LLWNIYIYFQEEKSGKNFDYEKEEELKDFCMLRMRNISERTLTMMVMEMRKLDRDRERIIHPSTLDNLIQKYKLPITPCLPRLKKKFEDKNYPGFTNYEHVVRSVFLSLIMILSQSLQGTWRREGWKDRRKGKTISQRSRGLLPHQKQ